MRYGPDDRLTEAMVHDAIDGYSPCPKPIIEILATWAAPCASGGTLFDNCAGDGESGNALAKAWNLRPVLVEPHPERHALCLRYDPNALCAPAQHIFGRGPTVWFFNPPYDFADETGSMERHLLLDAVARVPTALTFCVWLLPSRIFDDESLQNLVAKHFEALRVFRIMKPWEDYRQVALLGYWTDGASPLGTSRSQLVNLHSAPPLEIADTQYALKAVGAEFSVSRRLVFSRSSAA